MTQQATYDNVPVYTGQPPAESGYFQPPAPAADGILASDQARAVAEVQSALVIARANPRNELRARDRLLQACQRVSLASGALYQYSRGGTAISGPSIRLAEAAARAWGNMTYGFRVLSHRLGESDAEAFAWDLETNTKAVRQFTVRHRRDTKGGGYDLKDERDIYELIANNAQRRVRATILEIVPGDIIEDAVEQCENTLNANVGNLAEAAAKLTEAFAAIGVTREAIEKRLGHRMDAIQPAQIINFRKIFTSIKDGMSEPRDWFELEDAPQNPAPEQGAQTSPAGHQKPEKKTQAQPTAAKAKPEPEAKAKPQAELEPQKQAFPAASAPADMPGDTVPCPEREGNPVDEFECLTCSMRDGCPSWEE
mgnify:CR=1 FL=1